MHVPVAPFDHDAGTMHDTSGRADAPLRDCCRANPLADPGAAPALA